ncbi:MAG: hypothetical protein RLZZ262_1224 [Bacteroidota bacterium]|jgi:phosphohistidine phosphatase
MSISSTVLIGRPYFLYTCPMNELMIIRHAKSSWEDDTLSDFERPLNDRGRREAEEMAKMFAQSAWRPDLIVCSTALRAQQTMEFFRDALDPQKSIQIHMEPDIYDATTGTLLDIVNALPSGSKKVMMFGHNPGFSKLLAFLAGEYYEMPTCACGLVQMEIEDWIYIYENCGTLVSYEYPGKNVV